MARYAAGKRALGECDLCGFAYKLNSLREVINNGKNTGLLACKACWDADHPQNFIGRVDTRDGFPLRNPRPDSGSHGQSRARIIPIRGVGSRGFIGAVIALEA